ncbi:transcriptional regulator, AraC family with amidase-like domain [Arboricoccus pini]|uniref:Transcriptional regulator, AraC family with amidase-like domain n=1 Tax=Arboricoccus pini TaxID=1963835 RepID=A0A212RNH8_9PROT|nr:GlxA family transcriptional regulator [Arboricoccus pini]SNB74087.1 transcriptional regulator, AraC family with amidase-like domain [Arboricoccus pini]
MNIFTATQQPLAVTILVLDKVSLMSLAATLEPMRGANRVAGRRLFGWKLVSVDGNSVQASCGLPIAVEGAFDPRSAGEALFVVAAFDALAQAGAPLLKGLRQAAGAGVFMAGIEGGAWALARAGLLEGRRATTHWEDLEPFAARFPAAHVVPDRYIVDGPVGTTGGASPALDFMLALIRARAGRALALDVASLFIYDEVRAGFEAQPFVSLGASGSREPRLARAIKVMEERIEAPLTLAAVAARAGLKLRTMESLFQRHLQTAAGAYYTALRLGAARRLLVDAEMDLAEVATRTGFASAATLSRACRRRFGQPPGALRRAGRRARAGSTSPDSRP